MAGFRENVCLKRAVSCFSSPDLCPSISVAKRSGVCLSDHTFRDILNHVLHTLLCFSCCCSFCNPLCKNIIM